MKETVKFFWVIIIVFGLSTVLSAQHNQDNNMGSPEWDAAKEAFHGIMASTFHPAENGNFKPLRDNYGELAEKSKSWMEMAIPSDLNADTLKPLLKKLYKESKKVGKMVEKEASDEDLKTAIFALHGIFHEIVGMCKDH